MQVFMFVIGKNKIKKISALTESHYLQTWTCIISAGVPLQG